MIRYRPIITYLKSLLKPLGHLSKTNKILIGAVFAILAANFTLIKQPVLLSTVLSKQEIQPGGPITTANLVAVFDTKATENKDFGVSNTGLNGFSVAESDEELAGFALVEDSAFLSSSGPLKNILTKKENLMIYKVQSGDTISKVAENFGISVNTLIWANSSLSNRSLTPGQEIILLPVSGVIYKVVSGDTLESIAKLYKVDVEKIKQYNDVSSGLAAGTTLVIPGAKPSTKTIADTSAYSGLPKVSGYFTMPTTGWNWGRLHATNAVDIANSCGTPIFAAAEGLVMEVDSNGYNGGYGNYLKIEHSNGTKTLYAHASKIFVTQGQMVQKGELIANIGNTGNTHGYTGCHLHFEVYGAQNPFAKY
ncbi:MAG: peptidoglycan DD-metalloendopeptidase family protein [Candidatus Paceibacterota bacterium]|jgi:murein DD-endopeptidase MepM/ murein hydrolase activator NlpD